MSIGCARKDARSSYGVAPADAASARALSRLSPCTATTSTPGMPCAARTCVALIPPAPRMPIRIADGPGGARLREPLDLDLPVPHLVAVILEQDVAVLRRAETGDVLELALRDRGTQRRRVELVLEHLLAVQVVLDVQGADDHFARVPLPCRLHRTVVRRHHVVERARLPVRTDLRVGVALVVDHLVLVADGGGLVLEHEILDAAVASLRDLPLPAQVELREGVGGDDVALTLGVPLAGLRDRQQPALDLPARLFRVGFLVAAPALQCLAVEELNPGAILR